MPPELTAALVGIAIAASLGVQQLIKAIVKRQIDKMATEADEARKDRDAKRERELEAMRAETAKAQEDAAQAKAIGENLINLNATVIKLIDTHAREAHADREVLTNNTQTVGDLAESVDRVAGAVVDNTAVTKATGAKADAVVEAINHLEQILNTGIREIKLMLIPPPPPPNIVTVNTAPQELPKASGE